MIDLSLDHRVILNSEFDAGLQELDLLFNTETTELINDPTFGTNFEQFLWQLTPATSALKKYIIEKINDIDIYPFGIKHILFNIENLTDPFIKNLYKGEIRMIYDVQIHIEDNRGNKTTRKYQFR